MSKLRVGVIGTGNIAIKHLEVLTAFADVEVVALCNSGHPRIDDVATKFGIRKKFTDYRQLLDETKLDAAFVLVSVLRIPEIARECLQRSIPTLLEKPPGLSTAETQSLVEVAESTKCLNMVALNRRFYSVMHRAREAILEKGPLVSVFVDAPEWLPDYRAAQFHPEQVIKSILVANGIHCIDLLRFFGGDVQHVHSESRRWFEDQKDSFSALIRFTNGAVGQYLANWTTPGRWSVTLFGKGRRVTIKPLERAVITDPGEPDRELPIDEIDLSYKPGLYAQNRYFIDCVKMNQPPTYPGADLADALKTMKLIELIHGSDH